MEGNISLQFFVEKFLAAKNTFADPILTTKKTTL